MYSFELMYSTVSQPTAAQSKHRFVNSGGTRIWLLETSQASMSGECYSKRGWYRDHCCVVPNWCVGDVAEIETLWCTKLAYLFSWEASKHSIKLCALEIDFYLGGGWERGIPSSNPIKCQDCIEILQLVATTNVRTGAYCAMMLLQVLS